MNSPNILTQVRTFAVAAVAAALLAVPPAKAASAGMTLSNIFSFPADQYSVAGLVEGTNGNFYGTTLPVGTNGDGTVFMLTSAGVFTNLVSFDGANGSTPDAPLILARDGNFYGTTEYGGASNCGTIFSVSPSGVFRFRTNFGGGNGKYPLGGLVETTNGIFYGATSEGGTYSYGEVFSFSVTNDGLTNLYSFTGTNDGSLPDDLVIGVNGDLYGTTYFGGANDLGTVFRLTPQGGLTTLASFTYTNGAFPMGLVEAANGNIYGVTHDGGSNGLGVVFEIPNRSTSITVLTSFDNANGSDPIGPPRIGSDGLIYGTTYQGGAGFRGVVFQVATNLGRGGSVQGTNSVLSAEDAFQGSNGANPEGILCQGSNGNFYGTTTGGGANGTGGIFEVLGFPPTLLVQPTNLSLTLKGTAVFSAQAGGSQPLYYQWRMNGTNLTDKGNFSGATSNVLTISPEVLTDSASYTVIASNAFGTVTSSVAKLTVPTPTLTIKTPPANVTSATNVIQGTAADKYGVTNVFYQVLHQTNSGTNWATITVNGWTNPPTSTNWSVTVVLQGGSNIIKAYTVDPLGNPSLTSSVSVFYATYSPLTVTTNGSGKTIPNVRSTNLVVGKTYTISASPAKNYLFSNWSGTLTNSSNPLTFLMVSNMSLTANFVTNPFLKANVAGIYNGLFSVSNATGAASSGLIKTLKVGSNGIYTGRLYIGGSNYSLSGTFDVAGDASEQIQKTTAGTLTLAMNLDWNANPPQVTGTVAGKSGSAWTASLLAELEGSGLGSARYTMLIPPGTNTAVESPPGYGYATITNDAGNATLSWALADGSAFNESIAESATGDLAIYAKPYSNDGLLLGWLTVTNGSPEGDLTWIKPASSTGLFTNGYTNVVSVISSPWTNPPAHAAAVVLPVGQLEVADVFALPLIFDVSVSTTNQLVVNVPNSAHYKLTGSINAKTGVLSVSLPHVIGTETISGSGAVLQNQTNAAGFFVTKTNAGVILLR